MLRGFTCGAFDLLHAGHMVMFRDCRKLCDYLIVGLQTDPSIDRKEKNKPVQSMVERQMQLRGCKYVDEIVFYETERDLEELLTVLDIDVRFVGEDHRGKFFTGAEICKRRGIEIIYNKRDHNYSTSDLRERIKCS